jgi:hypothetical protein
MKALLLLILSVFSFCNLFAQDSSILKKIDSLAHIGYDKPDTVLCYLTEKDLLSTGAGTEIYLYKYKESVQRIVCFSHPRNRNVAIEFYPYRDTLLFVYESEEYAEEKAPAWTVKNFKGISSSEARFYFWNNQFIHWRGAGYSHSFTANEHASTLLKKFKEIMRWYTHRAGML